MIDLGIENKVLKDVADALLLLASDQAHWITGQLICIGGGWRMHQ